MSFVWGLLFYMMVTVAMIYQVDVVGLDPLQLVLVGTALEISAFLFEVPTGIVADTYSRRLSVVIGYVIIGFSFVLMGAIPTYAAMLVSSFVLGIGWTFISGANQAWLADEIGETQAAALYLKGARIGNFGAFLGILIAVVVGLVQINYPLIVAGLLFVLWGIVVRFVMPELGFTPQSAASVTGSFRQMGLTFMSGINVVRHSSTLLLLMVVGIVFGTFSEGYDRMSTAHLLRNFQFESVVGLAPVVVFGMMTAVGILLSIALISLAERRVDTGQARQLARALSAATLAIAAAVLCFALTNQVWLAVAMYVLLQPLRSVIDPLTMSWLNRNLPASSRATVISMHSQADALGQMAGGPGVGLLGRDFGIRFALTLAATLLFPAVLLYQRSIRRPVATEAS